MATMTDAKARFEALRKKAAAGPSVHRSSGNGNGLVRPHPLHNTSTTPFRNRIIEEKSNEALSKSESDHGPTKDVSKSSHLSRSEHTSRVPSDDRKDQRKPLVHNQRPSFAKRLPFHQMEAISISTSQTENDDDLIPNDSCYLPKKNKRSAILQRSPFHRMESESSIRTESSLQSETSQRVDTHVSLSKEWNESSESTDSSCHSVSSKRSAFLQRSPFHRMDSESSFQSEGHAESQHNKKIDTTKHLNKNQTPSFTKRSQFHAMEAKTTRQTLKQDVGKSSSDHGPSRRATNLPPSSLLSSTVHTSRTKTNIRLHTKVQGINSGGSEHSAFDELKAKLRSRLELEPSGQPESNIPAQPETNDKRNTSTNTKGSPIPANSPSYQMQSSGVSPDDLKPHVDSSPGKGANGAQQSSVPKKRSPFLNSSTSHVGGSTQNSPSPAVRQTSSRNSKQTPGKLRIVTDSAIPVKSPFQEKVVGSDATLTTQTESPSPIQRRVGKVNKTLMDKNPSPTNESRTRINTHQTTTAKPNSGSLSDVVTNDGGDGETGNEKFAEPLQRIYIEEVTEFEEEEIMELEEDEVVKDEAMIEISFEEEEEEVEESVIEEESKTQQQSEIGKGLNAPISAFLKRDMEEMSAKTTDGTHTEVAIEAHSLPRSTNFSSAQLRPSTKMNEPLTPTTFHGSSPSRELARHKSGPDSFQERSSSFHSPRQSPRSPIRQKSGPESFDGLPMVPVPTVQVSRKIRQVVKTLEFSSMISKDDTVKLFDEIYDLVKGNDTKQREFGVGKGIAGFVAVLKKHQDHEAVLESGFPLIAELANIETNRDALALHGCIEFILIAMLANEEGLVIQERGCNAIASLAKTPKYQEWIVASNGIEVIITIQSAYKSNAKIQTACLRAMHNLARDNRENTFNITAKGGVRSLMEIVKLPEHGKVLEFQMEACATMATLARTNDSNRGSIAAAGGLDVTLKAIRTFPSHEDLLTVAFDTLFCLATEHSQNTDTIVASHGVETMVQSMKIYESNLRLQESAIRLARLLTEGEATTKKFISAGGMKVVMASMRHFEESHTIQDEGCSTLLNMARQPENKETICGTGGIGIIVIAMKKLRDNPFVQKNGCKALECLATNDQNKKSIAAGGGVNAILSAMKKHSGVPALQGLAVSALKKLATIARNRNTMNSANCIETVERVMESYPTNTFLHNNGKALLLLLDPSRAKDDD